MGFFEEFGALMKKYNLQIFTLQLDENIKIMNEKFHLALKKEDLPPPLILLRNSEGNFVPEKFGPITLNNEEKNIRFINTDKNITFSLFPDEKDRVLTSTEEAQVVDVLNKLSKKLEDTQMQWEEVKTEPVNKYYIVGPMSKKQNCNRQKFVEFLNKNQSKLKRYNTSNDFIKQYIDEEDYKNGTINLTSKKGKEVIRKLEQSIDEYNVIVVLEGSQKSTEAKKLIKYAKEQNKKIIEEKDF